MTIVVDTCPPAHLAVHLDLAGRRIPVDEGAVLTLTDPHEILDAAATSARDVDWVVWRADAMPASERRIASFVVALAQRLDGDVFVVLNPGVGREHRIMGHLLRAGARRAAGEGAAGRL